MASVPQRGDVETIVILDEYGKGAGWARNRGLEKAKGEYVLTLSMRHPFCINQSLVSMR